MRTGAVVWAIAVAIATGAAAQPGPAPGSGDNVVVVTVRAVMVPRRLPGRCHVMGVVREVRDGEAFRPGEPISIAVPCADHAARPQWRGPPPEPRRHWPFPLDAEVLRRSKLGIARVDDSGELIWRGSARSYGRYGRVWGYRVLDGVLLPLGGRQAAD